MMANFLRKNLTTLILAASLGLNVTFVVLFISQGSSPAQFHRFSSERDMRGADYRRPDWEARMSAMPDSFRSRSFPRLEKEQVDSLRNLRHEMFTEIEPFTKEIATLQELIQEELRAPESNLTRLDSLTSRTMRLQYSIQQRTLRLILTEREILTPEQYQWFVRLMVPVQIDQMFDRGRGGRGGIDGRAMGPGRGGPPGRESETPPPPPHQF